MDFIIDDDDDGLDDDLEEDAITQENAMCIICGELGDDCTCA